MSFAQDSETRTACARPSHDGYLPLSSKEFSDILTENKPHAIPKEKKNAYRE